MPLILSLNEDKKSSAEKRDASGWRSARRRPSRASKAPHSLLGSLAWDTILVSQYVRSLVRRYCLSCLRARLAVTWHYILFGKIQIWNSQSEKVKSLFYCLFSMQNNMIGMIICQLSECQRPSLTVAGIAQSMF